MKLTILGKTYGVVYVRDQISIDSGMMGRSSLKDLEISIASHMPLNNMEETLLHEIIHQIADSCHIELSEQDVSTLSIGLYNCSVIHIDLPKLDSPIGEEPIKEEGTK